MNNAHNIHKPRMYPGEAVELALTIMNNHGKAETLQEIARLAGVYCRQTIQPWFVESHLKDLEMFGWEFLKVDDGIKVMKTGDTHD